MGWFFGIFFGVNISLDVVFTKNRFSVMIRYIWIGLWIVFVDCFLVFSWRNFFIRGGVSLKSSGLFFRLLQIVIAVLVLKYVFGYFGLSFF